MSVDHRRWSGAQTYPLVHVDGVLASDDVGDGRAASLAGLLGGGRHFYKLTELR